MSSDGTKDEQRVAELEAKLAELENKLRLRDPLARLVAHQLSDNIILLDLDYRIQYINYTVPDLTIEQVIGTPVWSYVSPEFQEVQRATYARVLETQKPSRFETRYVADGGSVSYWESRVSPVFEDGALVGLAQISSDVSERTRATADRDRFFSLSVDIMCIAGQDGFFKRLNPAFGRTLGYTDQELLTRPFADFIHPDDVADTREQIALLMAGNTAIDFQNRYRRKDGTYRWLSWQAVADATTGDLYAVARDVTERRALEDQLRQSQKMDAMGQLAGGVAHDFNNLVTVILGNTDFALAETDPTQRRQQLEEVRAAGERAEKLTSQLLAFSRQRRIHRSAVDVGQVAADVVRLLRRVIPASIAIELQLPDSLPAVLADPSQLEQVLINLCLNARDAMPNGGELTIRADPTTVTLEQSDDAPSEFLRITVADNGVGMTPEVQERLFEPFFTTKELGRGTGLGLATVYGIVEQHGGFVRVDSEPDVGSSLSVFLPQSRKRPIDRQAPVSETASGGTETILVAEDEEMVRSLVVRMLELAGYRVLVSGNGEEAVRVFRENPGVIDLVLLDVVMPRLSGPDALRKIRQLSPGTPAVFASGYSEVSNYDDSTLGDCGFLAKPYRMQALLQEVRQRIDESRRLKKAQ